VAFFKQLIDVVTLGSPRPVRRLAAYYALLGIVGLALFQFFPVLDGLLTGDRIVEVAVTPSLMQDALTTGQIAAPSADLTSRFEFGLGTVFIFLSTLALMLPVTWVYMSARSGQGHNQSVVQALLVLPMIVAGIVLIVRNSLALAFSLAGVVAAVRGFRTTLSDARDVVFIFLAIAVGFAAGVQVIMIALLLSMICNFVMVLIWRYDFGRAVLEPTAGSQWAEPLDDLAGKDQGGHVVPDRDLVLALTPTKVDALADRFARVRDILGTNGKEPKYNAVVTVTTSQLTEAQQDIEAVLGEATKRWKLDEVVTNTDKPSLLYYIIRTRKSIDRDALLTAIRERANGAIAEVDVEVGDALAREIGEKRIARKKAERRS
jgi:hypothetical protein